MNTDTAAWMILAAWAIALAFTLPRAIRASITAHGISKQVRPKDDDCDLDYRLERIRELVASSGAYGDASRQWVIVTAVNLATFLAATIAKAVLA